MLRATIGCPLQEMRIHTRNLNNLEEVETQDFLDRNIIQSF